MIVYVANFGVDVVGVCSTEMNAWRLLLRLLRLKITKRKDMSEDAQKKQMAIVDEADKLQHPDDVERVLTGHAFVNGSYLSVDWVEVDEN